MPKNLLAGQVQDVLDREHAGTILQGSFHFLLPDDDAGEAQALTTEFNKLVKVYKKAALQIGVPVLELIFSHDTALGASNLHQEYPLYMAVVEQAMQEHGFTPRTAWEGLVSIDFTKQDAWPQSWQKAYERGPEKTTRRAIHFANHPELADRALFIVDGYGKVAREKYGFMMFDDKHNAGTTLTRSSQSQTQADVDTGSLWFAKENVVKSQSDLENSPLNPVEAPTYDPERLNDIVDTMLRGLQAIETDPEWVVQIANRYGKTTTLRALSQALARTGNNTVVVSQYYTDGRLYGFNGEVIDGNTNFDEVKYLIIDEAGRAQIPQETSMSGLLDDLRSKGVHILRIYPGNAHPETDKIIGISEKE